MKVFLSHGRQLTLRSRDAKAYGYMPLGSRAPYDPTVCPLPFSDCGFDGASFMTDLTVRLDNATNRWTLTAPLVYRCAKFGKRITVPIGFDTDFASVPRFPPLIFALTGDSAHEAAVVHDYLYRFQQLTRCQSDAVLFEAMTASHQPVWREWLIWLGVRVGGYFAYHHNDKNPHTKGRR